MVLDIQGIDSVLCCPKITTEHLIDIDEKSLFSLGSLAVNATQASRWMSFKQIIFKLYCNYIQIIFKLYWIIICEKLCLSFVKILLLFLQAERLPLRNVSFPSPRPCGFFISFSDASKDRRRDSQETRLIPK